MLAPFAPEVVSPSPSYIGADVFRSRQLEIYRNKQLVVTIKSGTPIWEWHFRENGEQLSVHAAIQGDVGSYRLHDTATGKLVDQVNSVSSPSELPQWAKDRSELPARFKQVLGLVLQMAEIETIRQRP